LAGGGIYSIECNILSFFIHSINTNVSIPHRILTFGAITTNIREKYYF